MIFFNWGSDRATMKHNAITLKVTQHIFLDLPNSNVATPNGDVLDGDEILEELREMIEARRLAKASINGAPFGSIIKVIQTMALDLAQERQRARAYLDCLQPE